MADFDDARDGLTGARTSQREARDEVARARGALRSAQAALDGARRGRPGDDPHVQSLGQAVEDARGALAQARSGLADRRAALAEAVERFALFSDPRQEIERLDDAFPVLLFPVRLETRFKTVAVRDGHPREQLWVRVFPDSCLIDTFEPDLAAVEIENAQRYWRGIWRAGRVEADERAAWARLVAAHGSGRAGWIVDHYRPVNEADLPNKAKDSDVVLVVSTEADLGAERGAVADYWHAVWLADGAAAAEAAAEAALAAAVGAGRATELIALTRPFNLDDRPAPPAKLTSVTCTVAFVILPPAPGKPQTWTQAPRVDLLPDRFVLILEGGGERLEFVGDPVVTPLITGPDPSADPAEALAPDGEDLSVPDELAWLADFERALEVGMGFKVDLTAEQARRGFDRVTVLGVRLSADAAGGAAELEALLAGHRDGRSGLSIVAQGTPTNNTENGGSGFTRMDDPDVSFDLRRQPAPAATATDPYEKQDGQWLAELLGIDPAVVAAVPGAAGWDQRDARAMNTALWPATLGYFLETMLAPVVDEHDIDQTRWFFLNHVSGRGPVPALRVGTQPYGILATTAFSRMSWLRGDREIALTHREPRPYLARLDALLDRVEQDLAPLAGAVPAVGRPGDAHQTLLGILGLHPDSAEFHYRYAQTLEQLFNELNLFGFGAALLVALGAIAQHEAARELLLRLGANGREEPEILRKFFLAQHGAIGDLVDDHPVSETAGVHAWTDDGRTYLRWLRDAAGQSLDTLRRQSGFVDGKPPRALLYLMLRHALMLGYADAGIRLRASAGLPIDELRREPAFIHIDPTAASESRWAPLYAQDLAVTGGQPIPLHEHIVTVLLLAQETERMREQLAAIELLEDASTARLERALVEHIDCCSYRFDAWRLGFANAQLAAMRQLGGGNPPRRGVYLGAYAWLENLRRDERELRPVALDDDLERVFADGPPLMTDSANGGYIHAPSLNHATTAAVLRNGYLANATPAQPETFAVNLSSDRVRVALDFLDGMRNGQRLGALLGYRLARALHEGHPGLELDSIIFALRRKFPLRADKLHPTQAEEGETVDKIEARNVIDGLALVEHVRTSGHTGYPFGFTDLPQPGGPATAAIDAEVGRLVDIHDALGDLALAEGVHQAAQGNFDRASATLATFTSGHHPPDPDVARTPAAGVTLTHRVGIHLRPGLAAPAGATPRAVAEPAVNRWLGELLPPPAEIGCSVQWHDPVSGAPGVQPVTMAQLGLQPVDLVELLREPGAEQLAELDARVLTHALGVAAPRPDAEPAIEYRDSGGATYSVFEVAAQAAHLRGMLVAARPLRATDAKLSGEAAERDEQDTHVDEMRVTSVKAVADGIVADAAPYLAGLSTLLDDLPARRADVIDGVDTFLDRAVALLERGARLGLPLTNWSFAASWRRGRYASLVERLEALATRWDAHLAAYDARIAEYDALPASTPDADRIPVLRLAEAEIATAALPLPPTAAQLRTELDAVRAAFAGRRDALRGIARGSTATLSGLYAAVTAQLPLSPFTAEPFDLEKLGDEIVAFVEDLRARVKSLAEELDRRSKAAKAKLDEAAAAATGPARAAAVVEAAKALLGEDFLIVPEFGLRDAQGAEWQQAVAASTSGALLSHLSTQTQIELPVDEWLYGVARVRAPMRRLEQATVLAEGYGLAGPALVPMQLPHVAGEGWLGLDFPTGQTIEGERLLYTAQYSAPFNPAARQCGLLLDEWTEVVPLPATTTGLTFHYDQPNSEAPQSMLLVTPATWDGKWQWADLTAALDDTLALAKRRAVEPDQLDDTAYAPLLPATVMAATRRGISIGTLLATGSGVADHLKLANDA